MLIIVSSVAVASDCDNGYDYCIAANPFDINEHLSDYLNWDAACTSAYFNCLEPISSEN